MRQGRRLLFVAQAITVVWGAQRTERSLFLVDVREALRPLAIEAVATMAAPAPSAR